MPGRRHHLKYALVFNGVVYGLLILSDVIALFTWMNFPREVLTATPVVGGIVAGWRFVRDHGCLPSRADAWRLTLWSVVGSLLIILAYIAVLSLLLEEMAAMFQTAMADGETLLRVFANVGVLSVTYLAITYFTYSFVLGLVFRKAKRAA